LNKRAEEMGLLRPFVHLRIRYCVFGRIVVSFFKAPGEAVRYRPGERTI
jgi:hypothetical protein